MVIVAFPGHTHLLFVALHMQNNSIISMITHKIIQNRGPSIKLSYLFKQQKTSTLLCLRLMRSILQMAGKMNNTDTRLNRIRIPA